MLQHSLAVCGFAKTFELFWKGNIVVYLSLCNTGMGSVILWDSPRTTCAVNTVSNSSSLAGGYKGRHRLNQNNSLPQTIKKDRVDNKNMFLGPPLHP